LEKDNIKENQIKSRVEETEVQTSNMEATETQADTKNSEVKEGNTNIEIQGLVSDEENNENVKQNSFMKVILANILDQLLIVASSAVLLLLCDFVLKIFGYMFIRETGALVMAGGIIYFILNCIYEPIMKKTKIKNTIAKKILSIN
jgi:hypothetical protein